MSSAPPPPKDSPALELLDEYWFFSNTLASSNKQPREDSKGSWWSSPILRTPSPSNREQQQAAGCRQQEHDDDDLNWSSIYEGVLRTRMAEAAASSSRPALRRAPSMPVPSSSATGQAPKPTQRRPRRHQPVLPRSKSGVFNKCRSSGDLEPIHGLRALVRVQSEARSSAEVKDQLRMWAQAVACNVRQEC